MINVVYRKSSPINDAIKDEISHILLFIISKKIRFLVALIFMDSSLYKYDNLLKDNAIKNLNF